MLSHILKSVWYRSRLIGRLLLPISISTPTNHTEASAAEIHAMQRRAELAESEAATAKEQLKFIRARMSDVYIHTRNKIAHTVADWLIDQDTAHSGHGGSLYFVSDYLKTEIGNLEQYASIDDNIHLVTWPFPRLMATIQGGEIELGRVDRDNVEVVQSAIEKISSLRREL